MYWSYFHAPHWKYTTVTETPRFVAVQHRIVFLHVNHLNQTSCLALRKAFRMNWAGGLTAARENSRTSKILWWILGHCVTRDEGACLNAGNKRKKKKRHIYLTFKKVDLLLVWGLEKVGNSDFLMQFNRPYMYVFKNKKSGITVLRM